MMLDAQPNHALGVLPSPLWVGVGGWGPSAHHRTTPTRALRADPPHKGEGRTEFAAGADSISPEQALAARAESRTPRVMSGDPSPDRAGSARRSVARGVRARRGCRRHR